MKRSTCTTTLTPPGDEQGTEKRAKLTAAAADEVDKVVVEEEAAASFFSLDFYDSLVESGRQADAAAKAELKRAKLERNKAGKKRQKQENARAWNVVNDKRIAREREAKEAQERAKAEEENRAKIRREARELEKAQRKGGRFVVTKDAGARAPLGTSESIFNAARNNDFSVLLKLCREWAGTDIIDEHKNQDGWSAVFIAAAFGHEDCLRVLISANANVNIIARYGITALHCAAIEGHSGACKVLIQEGASLWTKNKCGHRPLESAKASVNNHACVAVLENAEKASRAP